MPQGILRAGKYGVAKEFLGVADLKQSLEKPLIPVETSLTSVDDEDDTLGRAGEDDATSYSDGALPESMSRKDTIRTLAVSLLVTGGLATAASAMIAAPTLIVFLMGGVCIANSPAVAKRHLNLLKGEGKRATLDMMRQDVRILKSEIDFLGRCVDDLQSEVDVLGGAEEKLRDIAAEQGTNVNELVRLVNENQETLDQMKANLRQMFVNSLTRAVLRSDTDGDMKISLKELPLLTMRLQISLERYGISLDTRKFEDMVEEDNCISSILKFCANLLYPEEADQDDDSVDSELTFDFEQFCHDLDDEVNDKMTLEEKFSIATVDEKYSRGSLEVARGKRMTLLPSNSVRCMSSRDSRRRTIVKEVRKSRARMTVMRATVLAGASRRKETSRVSLASGMVIVPGRKSQVSRS